MNDSYEIDYNKIQTEQINRFMQYGTIKGFALELKKLAIEDDWVISYGFTYLPNLVYFTLENLPEYKNYGEFVEKAMPIFINSCIDQVKINK